MKQGIERQAGTRGSASLAEVAHARLKAAIQAHEFQEDSPEPLTQ